MVTEKTLITNLDVDGGPVVDEEFGDVDVALFARLHQCRQPRSTEGVRVGSVAE